MHRHAQTGIDRSRLTWLLVGMLAVVSAALLVACGGSGGGSASTPVATVTVTVAPSASPSSAPSATASTALSLYFVRAGELGVAERRVPQTTMPATAALKALLNGPSAGERAAGLSSDIPVGTRLIALTLDGGTVTADLTAPFALPAANAVAARRVAEVVYTLTRFPTIRRVVIAVGGQPLNEIASGGTEGSPDPLAIAAPLRRTSPWTSFEPAIFVETPGVGAVLSSPCRLSGTASVFEGSFTARLVDGAGKGIGRTQVQASIGAPERGSFRTTLSFSTTTQSGTLIVYAQSMEDGSRQHEVRIPVTFGQE